MRISSVKPISFKNRPLTKDTRKAPEQKEISSMKKYLRALDIEEKEYSIKDAMAIFNYFGIETSLNHDYKTLTISEYFTPDPTRDYSKLGINEKELFKHVSRIKGNANFYGSNLEELENLVLIKGNANFSNSKIKKLGKLSEISGNANFNNSKVEDLGSLKTIGGNVRFGNSELKSLKNLKLISGDAHFSSRELTDTGNLQEIEGIGFYWAASDELIEKLNKVKMLGNFKYGL